MTKIETAAQIILESTLELLAKTHGCTVDQVAEGLRAGNVKLARQFRECAERGAAEAVKLAKQSKIFLH